MVVTLSGPTGLHVAGHAQKGLSSTLVRAPVPHQQTAEETVGDWDKRQNQGNVSYVGAQVNFFLPTLKKEITVQ